MRSCNQCDDGCEGSTNIECFSCGMPVCAKCSKKTEYHHYGIKRLCNSCLCEHERHIEGMKRADRQKRVNAAAAQKLANRVQAALAAYHKEIS